MWTDDFLYCRFIARDRSYDGRFLTGVLTTGIYCLPSCVARKPKRENVRFFRHPDEAQAAGFRPCRRCSPELFYCGEDWDRGLFEGLLARIRAEPGAFRDVDSLATACGVSATKLTELTRTHAHLTPAALLRGERVHAACTRLLMSDQRVIAVGHDVGFEGESTFHRHFVALTGLTPGGYRALRETSGFVMQLPRGFRPEESFSYHGRDPHGVSERVLDGCRLWKALVLDGENAALELTFKTEQVGCQVHASGRLSPQAMVIAHRAAMRLLGLGSDALGFEGRATRDRTVAQLVDGRWGLRVPLAATPFEALTWAIIGQQINVSFATALRRALIELAGEPVATVDRMRVHPTPEAVAALEPHDLTQLRFSRSKAEYVIGAARLVANGTLPLEALGHGSAQAAEGALTAVRGLGPWTARYTMLRGLGFGDCTPVGDSGLSTALQRFHQLPERPDAKKMEHLMFSFAPHRSLATCHLWAHLTEARS